MRSLMIRPGAIGDFIVSLPAMECLRTEYTEVWAASQNLPLAPFAGRRRSIASTGLDLLGIADCPAVVESLRTFDRIVSWYGSNRPEFRELTLSLGLPFHFFRALPPDQAAIHAVDYYLGQAAEIADCSPIDPVPRIECRREPKGFAVVHPFSGSKRKNWPLERFEELARWLESLMPVAWCAGPEDPLPRAVRIDDLYELACWLGGARLFIGNDAGISHLAAAVGVPVIALFGPTDPRVWAPRGPVIEVVRAEAMDRISLPQVRAAIERLVSTGTV
jgi:heptosyltransferase III